MSLFFFRAAAFLLICFSRSEGHLSEKNDHHAALLLEIQSEQRKHIVDDIGENGRLGAPPNQAHTGLAHRGYESAPQLQAPGSP